MKNKSRLLVYLLLFFSVVMLSVTTTLALIQDSESKVGNMITFGNVSIFADKAGQGEKMSVLSTELSSNLDGGVVANGDKVITEENQFKVATTDKTADCFIRLRFYFTTTDEQINEENEALLESMSNGVPPGMNLYSDENYEFTIHEGYVYLVVNDNNPDTTSTLLKVATKNDNAYIITKDYTFNFDETLMLDITELSLEVEAAGGELMLVTEVQAVQAYGLHTLEDAEGVLSTESTLFGEEDLEAKYGNVTIYKLIKAIIENTEKSGLPQESNVPLEEWTWEQINLASELIEIADSKKRGSGNNYTVKYKTITITSLETGTRGTSNYDWTFTFNEFDVTNSISLYNNSKDKQSYKDVVMQSVSCDEFGDNVTVSKTYGRKVKVIVSDFLHDTRRENGESKKTGITFTSYGTVENIRQTRGYYDIDYFDEGDSYKVNLIRRFLVRDFFPALNRAVGDGIVKYVYKYEDGASKYDPIFMLSESEVTPSYSNAYPVFGYYEVLHKNGVDWWLRTKNKYHYEWYKYIEYKYWLSSKISEISEAQRFEDFGVVMGFCI